MKCIYLFFFVLLMFLQKATAQTTQISIGTNSDVEYFNDLKVNAVDGSTVNVGYKTNGFTGNDLLIVKLNNFRQIVWSKTILNNGDDRFTKVFICNNGDYIAVGQIFQLGKKRGIICRINSNNGNIIWSDVSANSSAIGEVFWDVIETTNNNIAVVGYESFTAPSTNCYVVLLNSSGIKLWSFISTTGNSDGFQAINQLPNGRLIIGGIFIGTLGQYDAVIAELDEPTGVVLSQNTYQINTIIPENPILLTTISPIRFYIKNNNVICNMSVYRGYGSASHIAYFDYNQTTKNLSGNILINSGTDNANAYCFYPITETDYLVGASYISPASAYVSRITNGTIAYNKKINSTISALTSLDITGGNAFFAGVTNSSATNGSLLFSTIDVPASITPCDIANVNSLSLQPQICNATSQDVLGLLPSGIISSIALTLQDVTLNVTDICGFVLPIQLLSFNVACSPENKVKLHWTTASESNSKEFIVEKLIKEGNSYYKIGSVAAAGNSNVLKQYHFTDINPINGKQFYRLKMVDRDGTFKYSDIEVADCSSNQYNEFSISPVPAETETWIRYAGTESQNITVDIYDAAGKLMKHQTAFINASNPVRITLQELSAGLYFLKITSKNNNTVIKKIMVQ